MTFIPPTEHCNLMPMSDNWVIENVLKQLDKNKIDTVYAVNLSGQSLIDNKSTQHTTYNIQHTTETSTITNLENATQSLKQLQELGFLLH